MHSVFCIICITCTCALCNHALCSNLFSAKLFKIKLISENTSHEWVDLSGGQKNDMNACIVWRGIHCSASRDTIVVTPNSTCHQFIICMFYLSKLLTEQDFVFKYPAILLYTCNAIKWDLLNCGSFIVHILLAGTSKAFTLSVFLPGTRVHVILLGTWHIVQCLDDA